MQMVQDAGVISLFCFISICRQIPYAFWHLPLKHLPDGFPVFLDINLSEVGPVICSPSGVSNSSSTAQQPYPCCKCCDTECLPAHAAYGYAYAAGVGYASFVLYLLRKLQICCQHARLLAGTCCCGSLVCVPPLQVGAQTWLSWIQEGLLLDDRTQGLVARLVSYNAELKVFAAIQVNFDFQQGGSIKVGVQMSSCGMVVKHNVALLDSLVRMCLKNSSSSQ